MRVQHGVEESPTRLLISWRLARASCCSMIRIARSNLSMAMVRWCKIRKDEVRHLEPWRQRHRETRIWKDPRDLLRVPCALRGSRSSLLVPFNGLEKKIILTG